jgi:hypothetical protein
VSVAVESERASEGDSRWWMLDVDGNTTTIATTPTPNIHPPLHHQHQQPPQHPTQTPPHINCTDDNNNPDDNKKDSNNEGIPCCVIVEIVGEPHIGKLIFGRSGRGVGEDIGWSPCVDLNRYPSISTPLGI